MNTDEQIRMEIMEQFRRERNLTGSKLVVTVRNGKIILSGYVDSYPKRLIAEMAVRKVSAGLVIIDEIQVANLPANRTDAEITADIFTVLRRHMRYGLEPVKINVENGIVKLEGHVKWNFQRQNIQSAIEGIRGVLEVHNLISIESQNSPLRNESGLTGNFDSGLQRRAAA
jgi:osmotically-inducible protein OsmY